MQPLKLESAAAAAAAPEPPSARVFVVRRDVRPGERNADSYQLGPLATATEPREMALNRWHFYDDGSVSFAGEPRMLLGYLFRAHSRAIDDLQGCFDVLLHRLSQLSDRLKKLEDRFEAISAGQYTPQRVPPAPPPVTTLRKKR
jgi:hypothetical protein